MLNAKKSCQPLQQLSSPQGELVNDFSVDNLGFQFLCYARTIPTQRSTLGLGLILNVRGIFWKYSYSLPPLDTEPAPQKMAMTGSCGGFRLELCKPGLKMARCLILCSFSLENVRFVEFYFCKYPHFSGILPCVINFAPTGSINN